MIVGLFIICIKMRICTTDAAGSSKGVFQIQHCTTGTLIQLKKICSTSRARMARVVRCAGICSEAGYLLDLLSNPSLYRSTTRATYLFFSRSINSKTESQKTKPVLRSTGRASLLGSSEPQCAYTRSFCFCCGNVWAFKPLVLGLLTCDKQYKRA